MRRRTLLLLCAAAVIGWVGGPAWAGVSLQVSPVQGGASLEVDFGTARSLGADGEEESDTVIRQVKLKISSDSSRSYRVLQRMNGPWAGPDGKEIPVGTVQLSVSESGTGGTNRFPTPSTISLGEQEIFLSSPSGAAEDLLLTYTVKIPVGQRAGSYRTTVSYQVVG